ncbi:MAG: PHP-associated domain-containing protein [archaeon]|jgi:hypothetical protein
MKYLVDMHTHFNEKKLKKVDWWESVIEKKLCAVAITEHANYNPGLAYKRLLTKKPKDVLLIPGMEANTNAGHLLIYGRDESLYKIKKLQELNVDIEKALQLVNENKLLASFSHPFGYKYDSTCEIIGEKKTKELLKKYGVGVEYYNGMLGSANNFIFGTQWVKKLYNFFDFMSKSKSGRILKIKNTSTTIKNQLDEVSKETFARVRKGIEFSQNANFITVGSDAHYPRVIGSAIIELKRKPKNNSDFLTMIKTKQIIWAGPNMYAKEPVDNVTKKELLEGLKYATTNKLKKKIKRKKNPNGKTKFKQTKEKLIKIKNKLRRNKK